CSSRRRHTRCYRDWSSDVCSSDLPEAAVAPVRASGGDGLMIGDKDVEHVARLARLALTESERARMREQLSAILQYIDKLKAVDVEGVDPTSRSEERRVGKECGAGCAREAEKINNER